MDRLGPNRALIGRPDSRRRLMTPVLVLDLDRLDANIARMARWARGAGLRLRPHAKTHKSAEIARRQVEAGAAGICCTTLGEAEAMVAGGIADVLITSPIVTAGKLARLAELNRAAGRLAVVADDPDNVALLAEVGRASGRPLAVLVEADIGQGRTGVQSPEAAVAVARRIGAAADLRFAGLQGYAGFLQHVEDFAARRDGLATAMAKLRAVVEALEAAGLAPAVVTGGGTGTHRLDAEFGLLGELQVGSYVFMDVEYNAVDIDGSGRPPYDTALFVQATVVSANRQDRAIIDAGFKCLFKGGPLPVFAEGAPAGAGYRFMGDEHGAVEFAAPGRVLAPGAVVSIVTPHCDPTVNLFDQYHCVRGDLLLEIWPIAGRGRSA